MSGSSYKWNHFLITSPRTGRKGRITSELQPSLIRNATQNASKALPVHQGLIKKSQEMGGPMAFQHLYPSTEKAVPNNLCSWSPELQASTGEIYNAALTASSVRGGFPLALCRKCSKQFHWKASLKHIYISKLSLRKSSLSQSVHWGFPTTS